MNNFKNKKREKWSEDSFQAEDAAQNPFFFSGILRSFLISAKRTSISATRYQHNRKGEVKTRKHREYE